MAIRDSSGAGGASFALERYRFRTRFARNGTAYLSLILLIGFVGGLALASVAGARRTDASFTVFWASTNPSDLSGGTGILGAPATGLLPYDPRIIHLISSLPHVKQVESESGLNILPLARDGAPRTGIFDFTPGPGNGYGSVDGLGFNQDKVAILAGHLAEPSSPDQFMLTADEADLMGLHVGDSIRMGIYTNAQITEKGFGTPAVPPYKVVEERLVGVFVENSAVVEDQADIETAPDNLFTPALTRPLLHCCVNYTESGIVVSGGPQFVPVVQNEITAAAAKISPALAQAALFADTGANAIPKAQRAIKPEAIALGVFGAVVALACLLIGGQLIGRQIRAGADDRAILRALGADPLQTSSDGLLGILASVLLGGVLAVIVAIALSPLAPLGPVRAVYPDRGVAVDWTVIGIGLATFVFGLGAVAVVANSWSAPHRAATRDVRVARVSRLLSAASASGLPVSATTGIRFALVPGAGRTAVPVRSAVLGAVMAVIALVGTVTFAASLTSLVNHPPLYGWNWDYLLGAGSNLPEPQAAALLDGDRYIAAWSGAYTGQLAIDGQQIPVLGENPGAAVGPPLLSGNAVKTAQQVVLGSQTAEQLHTRVGGTVLVTEQGQAPVHLRVVGTATLPAFGSGGQHLEMGVGAVLDYRLLPEQSRNLFGLKDAGPEIALLRLRTGGDQAAAYRSLQKIADETSNPQNFGVTVVGVQRPAEILNYRSLGATPVFLGVALGAGAVAALALTLVASVRRRRRDLALLRTLGFTKRQLASTVAWHATTAVTIGLLVGVPLGIALGRWLWDLFAKGIDAVPAPVVPVGEIAIITAGALLVANVVAALPGRLAARTPSAMIFTQE